MWRRRLPATRPWGPIVGMSACQEARGTKTTVGRQGGGEGGRVRVFARRETGGAGGRWRSKGGKCSNSSSSCRCQCPPSRYPRRGPLEDIGGDHEGPSASQPVVITERSLTCTRKILIVEWTEMKKFVLTEHLHKGHERRRNVKKINLSKLISEKNK